MLSMNQKEMRLKVGAGKGEIVFPEAMFPMPEGFTTIHDHPHARVMLFQREARVAIVSLELIICPEDCVDAIRRMVSEATGTPKEHVWVHSTHVFSTPHAPRDPADRAMFCEAVLGAAAEAVNQAVDALREAKIGVTAGKTAVIANRNVKTKDGYVAGLNGEGPCDPTLTVLKAETPDGKMIGLLFACAAKSYCTDVSRGTGGREITSDFTGVAAAMLEEKFGAPALFCMTAAGDQHPIRAALSMEVDAEGCAVTVDLGVQEGLKIARELGTVFGGEAIAIAEAVTCGDGFPQIACTGDSFAWAGKNGETKIDVEIMRIGEAAFVGVKQEVDSITALELVSASPFEYTVLMTFINGDQGYMPHAQAYERHTAEAAKTNLSVGAAERLVEVSVNLLEELK